MWTATLARPAILDDMDLRVGTVVEASAGTGKTFLLENLVLELVLTGRARLEEILVVTFTERATAELRVRIGTKIARALADFESPSPSPSPSLSSSSSSLSPSSGRDGWRRDEVARARLLEARSQLDSAPISTIHGFCQRILTEDPFSTQRLLLQTQTDGRRLFSEVFRDRLRHLFATAREYSDYLDAYLSRGQSIEALEQFLARAFQSRGTWAHPYDEAALDVAMTRLAALDPPSPEVTAAFRLLPGRRQPASVRKYFLEAAGLARSCLEEGSRARLLAHLDDSGKSTFLEYLRDLDLLPADDLPRLPLIACAKALLEAAPSLEEAVAQKFLPPIAALIHARKLAEGTFDYDDMITSVADALDGPTGDGLTARIRDRYRVALIDEAQDTEPAQWRIFRRCFLDSGGTHALVLVGDPKQAIYGFRGADVRTFLAACEDIVERGGRRLSLTENFRSYAQVADAYNAIFDSSAEAPYFSGEVRYDAPVRSARGPGPPAISAGVTLMTLDASVGAQRAGRVRETMRNTIVRSIAELVQAGSGGPPAEAVDLAEIFVLTRSNAESLEIAEALRAAGIANALYKPDHLFATVEAHHIRTLIAAIANPADRVARFQAWLTPFFGITLDELARNPDPPAEHPAHARLRVWHELAADRDYAHLWSRILRDSGVVRRLRMSPSSQRRLANYRQIFDVLLGETTTSPKSLGDLVSWLTSLGNQRRSARTESGADEPGTQKMETESPAVQILTIHKAKGLEADCVFVYGAFTRRSQHRGQIHVFHREGERVLRAGHLRRVAGASQIAEEAEQEDQRLLYVALTRARRRLFLPFASRLPSAAALSPDSSERETYDDSPLTRLTGAYRVVNRRLETLARSPARFNGLFALAEVTPSEVTVGGADASLDWKQRLGAWRPPAEMERRISAGIHPEAHLGTDLDKELQTMVATSRRGFTITSYSRLQHARTEYAVAPRRPEEPAEPEQLADPSGPAISLTEHSRAGGERAAASPAASPSASPSLVGGIQSGLFLHALLEKLPLGRLPPYASWRIQPEVQRLLGLELRRWERDERQGEAALDMVYGALTARVATTAGTRGLPGIAQAQRVRREVDFLFPLPGGSRAQPEAGFVRGVLDVLFEHDGKIFFADWKSDALPDFAPEALARHVERNYALQIRLYSLALIRMLGITRQADYELHFGGSVYVFLRGLPTSAAAVDVVSRSALDSDSASTWSTPGIFVDRPTWETIRAWEAELPRLLLTDAAVCA
jgi:exodeoxyribonuclease V beta subunit